MNALSALRLAGWLEGISYVLLLGIAMPLKYFMHLPLAVRITGMAHGALFLWFLATLMRAHMERSWPVGTSARYLISAIVPFGFLWVDKSLRQALAAEPDRT